MHLLSTIALLLSFRFMFMVKRLFVAFLITITFGNTLSSVNAYNFEASDVPSNHPNYTAINSLIADGIMHGYPDGRFRPNQPINRVEALKIVIGSHSTGTACCAPANSYQFTFRDTEPNAWYVPYLIRGINEGIISGYSDGFFRPAQTITSPELLKMLAKAHGVYINETSTSISPYKDVSLNAWYLPYMIYAKNRDILPQKDYIRPDKPLSRGEASELIYRFMRNQTDDTVAVRDENNLYTIPADTHIMPPTYGETEIRKSQNMDTEYLVSKINKIEERVTSAYPQTAVVQQEDDWNWWPVYNVSQRVQNGVNTKFPDVIFGHVQFMNAWNMISNSINELNRYTQDHLNYTYQYNDISKPGEYVYTLE